MKAFYIWTTVCILSYSWLVWTIVTDSVYVGRTVTIAVSDSHEVKVAGVASVRLEAAGSQPFSVLLPSDVLEAKEVAPPLGWVNRYYHVEPTQVAAGLWTVDNAATLRITSDSVVIVNLGFSMEARVIAGGLVFLLIFLIWFIGLKMW